jgi:hypothetical protein
MIIKHIVFMIIFCISILINGCKSSNTDNENWPYQGVPTVGTNQIPIPHY